MPEVAGLAKPVLAYLALGSNLGDKVGHLDAAVAAIAALPETRLTRLSSVYRTPPWGNLDQDWFANAVVGVETGLTPEALLAACLEIEQQLGRIRRERWGPRVIDIDVLLHGEARMKTGALTLPHPAMTARAFVLVPLQEIAPGLVLEGQPLAAWLAGLDRAGIEPMARLAEPAPQQG